MEDEAINEQIVLKFIKKDQVPSDFKNEALKICETLEKESEKRVLKDFGQILFGRLLEFV